MSNVSLINGHIDGSETCDICGREIPEGRQECVICGYKPKKQTNMTDNEIVNSLKEYIDFSEKMGLSYSTIIYIPKLKNVLDLINRLQAENERLKLECGLAKFDKYKAEFEEFRTEIETKAYKEFAERLKEKLYIDDDNFNPIVTETEIDNLLKELVGEEK